MRHRHLQSLVLAVSAVVALAPAVRAERSPPKDAPSRQAPKDAGQTQKDSSPRPSPKDGTSRPPSKDGASRPTTRAEAEEVSTEAEMARAAAYYEAGQYTQCADAFAAMLDDPDKVRALSPRSRDQAQVYDAA